MSKPVNKKTEHLTAKTAAEPMKALTVHLPVSIHNKFKACLALEGVSITQAMYEYVADVIADYEEKSGEKND